MKILKTITSNEAILEIEGKPFHVVKNSNQTFEEIENEIKNPELENETIEKSLQEQLNELTQRVNELEKT